MSTVPFHQELLRGADFTRHAHAEPYAALVLGGRYEEAGEAGRWRVREGDVLVHAPYAIHHNRSLSDRALILNLPLPMGAAQQTSHFVVPDPDLLARVAERDPTAASGLLLEQLLAGRPAETGFADRLACTLSGADAIAIGGWSRSAGVRRETAFRRFRAAYGVAPARYRLEARARRAWRDIVTTDVPLAQVAVDAGFADQAHMTRSVRMLTGQNPSAWRAVQTLQHSFNTR